MARLESICNLISHARLSRFNPHFTLRTVSELFKRVEKLEIENKELKERLNNNSSNSSLPSKDYKLLELVRFNLKRLLPSESFSLRASTTLSGGIPSLSSDKNKYF